MGQFYFLSNLISLTHHSNKGGDNQQYKLLLVNLFVTITNIQSSIIKKYNNNVNKVYNNNKHYRDLKLQNIVHKTCFRVIKII